MVNYCRSGRRCAAATDRERLPAEVGAPETYCLDCLDRAAGRVRNLPAQYGRLQLLLSITQPGQTIRRTAPGPTVLVNLAVDTIARDIAYTLHQAAEIVADALGHAPDDVPPRHDLHALANLVADNLARLADHAPWPLYLWARAGTWRQLVTAPPILVVERLDRLACLAGIALGATRARTHRDLPCARCRAKTVGRWAGSDYYDCATCGARFHVEDIARQDRILVELYRRGQLRANP